MLHRLGYRFRLHGKKLPGRPDIALARHKTVIFVRGCFGIGIVDVRTVHQPAATETSELKKLEWNPLETESTAHRASAVVERG
ncbi:MAG: hypothetical protein AABN34_20910 [Acidobacteriota bacterium]